MTSAPVEGRGCTVHQLFNGHRYQLDYYQREYTWGSENVRRLVQDLHRRFSAEWNALHDRRDTSRYKPYFLGPYVSPAPGTAKAPTRAAHRQPPRPDLPLAPGASGRIGGPSGQAANLSRAGRSHSVVPTLTPATSTPQAPPVVPTTPDA